MGNMLSTVVIVLAEIIAILLIALGAALYLHRRQDKRHRAELQAVIGIARHVEQTAACGQADTSSPPAEATARIDQSIGELREAIARLDVKFSQIHLEDERHGVAIAHQVAEENTQMQTMREELDKLTLGLHELGLKHATLDQKLNILRVAIEDRAPPAGVKSAVKPSSSVPRRSLPTPAKQPAAPEADDFTLPDSVLAELEEVTKLAASPAAAPAGAAPSIRTMAPSDARKPETPRSRTSAPQAAARSTDAVAAQSAATMKKTGTVDEPQYAFDPARIEDRFTVPLFIPGAANTGINVEELDFEDLNLEHPHDRADTPHKEPHYDADRVFYQASPQTGIKAGWYFTLRGGKTHGPFGSKEAAARVLNEMIEQFKRTGDTGGR